MRTHTPFWYFFLSVDLAPSTATTKSLSPAARDDLRESAWIIQLTMTAEGQPPSDPKSSSCIDYYISHAFYVCVNVCCNIHGTQFPDKSSSQQIFQLFGIATLWFEWLKRTRFSRIKFDFKKRFDLRAASNSRSYFMKTPTVRIDYYQTHTHIKCACVSCELTYEQHVTRTGFSPLFGLSMEHSGKIWKNHFH
jgi:hypothetical protein